MGVTKQGCPICSAEKRELQAEIAKKKREEREAKKKEREKNKALILANEKTIKIKKTKLENFLEKARAKYGDTYDYSLVDYKGREIPINIICKIHGVFPITPRTFLQGQSKHPSHGCPKCDGIIEQKKITQDDFLQIVREKHGEKWDLSTVQYRSKSQILGLSCPDCNESFNTTPEKLMDGLGCPRCEGRIKDLRYYVEEAKKVHGDKYDYSECYLTYEKKHQILNNIRCEIHGFFSTRADVHIKMKCRCPKCYPQKDKIPLEERRDAYIRRAIERHGEGRFDYSQVDYHRKRDKVKIRCIIHDYWFYQSLEEHTKKKSMGGCPLCSETTGEREVRLFLEKKKLEYTAQMEIENIRPDILKLQYMRVDFYVKKYRLIIEYNGEQHYKNCGWYKNSKRNLEMQQLRDEVLREYCQKFNFNLLEIKYSEFDNIGKLINAKIKEIKANEKKGNSNYGTH
jgi:very-short-patch-repair endonuclease